MKRERFETQTEAQLRQWQAPMKRGVVRVQQGHKFVTDLTDPGTAAQFEMVNFYLFHFTVASQVRM